MTEMLSKILAARREALRVQLTAQRQLIARQLDQSGDDDYPRSQTMRFLRHKAIPAAATMGGVASLMVGLRFYRTISGVLAAMVKLRSTRVR